MPDISIFEKVTEKCQELFGQTSIGIESLAESGSARSYYRLFFHDSTVILCVSDSIKENRTFISLTHYLYSKGINVPKIYAFDSECKWYLLEDLGNANFLSLILNDKIEQLTGVIIQNIFKQLVKFQFLPEGEWNNMVEFPALDKELIFYDFNYAVNNFFSVSKVIYEERRLREDFEKLAFILLSFPQSLWGMMYRDFQSRNIMIFNEKPYFIDYQSARKGPCIYDFVSFAWQAKAGFTNDERRELTAIYIRSLKNAGIEDAEVVKENIPYWGLFRIIQTLGAYGLRGLKERKLHFLQSIPIAVRNVIDLMEKHSLSEVFPELYSIMRQLKVERDDSLNTIKV